MAQKAAAPILANDEAVSLFGGVPSYCCVSGYSQIFRSRWEGSSRAKSFNSSCCKLADDGLAVRVDATYGSNFGAR